MRTDPAAQALLILLGAMGLPTDDISGLWLRLETVTPLERGPQTGGGAQVAVLAHWRAASLRTATVDQLVCISADEARGLAAACARAGLRIVDNCVAA